MIEEVAFKSATTVAAVVEASSKRGIHIAVKLSNGTSVEFAEVTIPEVEFADVLAGMEPLAGAASPKNVWRASKYCTYQRTQSFHRAFVQLAGLGLDTAVMFQEAQGMDVRSRQTAPPEVAPDVFWAELLHWTGE